SRQPQDAFGGQRLPAVTEEASGVGECKMLQEVLGEDVWTFGEGNLLGHVLDDVDGGVWNRVDVDPALESGITTAEVKTPSGSDPVTRHERCPCWLTRYEFSVAAATRGWAPVNSTAGVECRRFNDLANPDAVTLGSGEREL